MRISSRTPEGTPNRCPVCGHAVCIDPSHPPGDAPCPDCGCLMWFCSPAEWADDRDAVPSAADEVDRLLSAAEEVRLRRWQTGSMLVVATAALVVAYAAVMDAVGSARSDSDPVAYSGLGLMGVGIAAGVASGAWLQQESDDDGTPLWQ